jgi:hypothetical protein
MTRRLFGTVLPVTAVEAWIPDTTFFASLEGRSRMTNKGNGVREMGN